MAAHRECLEEANVKVLLKGILRVDYSLSGKNNSRMRVIYYAEPVDIKEANKFKFFADKESRESRWVSLDELKKLGSAYPGLRGPELQEWAEYLEHGGAIYPLSVFG